MPASWFFKRIPCRRRCRIAAALTALALATGCAGNYRLLPRHAADDGLTWLAPAASKDLRSLDRWRQSVGPALVVNKSSPAVDRAVRQLIVVSWNIAVGSADVVAFLRDLRERSGADVPVVLLLQEAYRESADVPVALGSDARFASRLGSSDGPDPHREDIATIAETTGLNVYYAPSMRNGSPLSSAEDRGNAILSSAPLTDLTAIELPFERQRRVAIAATVAGVSANGDEWRLRVVSAHLDNVAGPRRFWVFGSELARTRQARALVTYLADPGPTVLAGDFNTWFGFSDRAYRETVRAFPGTVSSDRRATFRGLLRLDHVFFRLPEGWRAHSQRGSSRFGSDHFPLIATIDLE
jgi:endonuclease/exonuclease/phosphatase family metal-dependent hydrolase